MTTILAGLEKEGKEKLNRIDRISADKENSKGNESSIINHP